MTFICVQLYPDRDMSEASVTYEYSVNKKDVTLERRKYEWRFKDWSACSVTCGEGSGMLRMVCCISSRGGYSSVGYSLRVLFKRAE